MMSPRRFSPNRSLICTHFFLKLPLIDVDNAESVEGMPPSPKVVRKSSESSEKKKKKKFFIS